MTASNYLRRVEALELERDSRDHHAPEPIHILNMIVDPDSAIGTVGVVVTQPECREFERMSGESVEDLKNRVVQAMGCRSGEGLECVIRSWLPLPERATALGL